MLKKLLIAFIVIVVALAATLFYMNNRSRTLSPPGTVELTSAGMDVTVAYSRPSVKDRLIFGEKEEGALLPYGYYWRLGANEPTILTVSEDFEVGGKNLAAGQYVLYAYPRKGEMELVFNDKIEIWGTIEPEKAHDKVTLVVPMQSHEATEQFTITLEATKKGINVAFLWDTFLWEVPLRKR